MPASTPPHATRSDLAKAVDALPPLPAVALKVMQVAQDPKSSASDLAMVVSADPGLSARILRVVNSAAYRRANEVTSVQQALVVLGFVQARNIAISSAITSAYTPDALNALFRISAFWRHSLAVGFRAADIAARGRRLDVPSAFTAGILHNIGRLAMFYHDPAGVDQAVATAMGEDRSLEEVERELLGYDHASLGGELAEKWKLPLEIREAVAQHHDHSGSESNLAGVVASADAFCMTHGIFPGYVIPSRETPVSALPDEVSRLLRQVDTLMELVGSASVGVRMVA